MLRPLLPHSLMLSMSPDLVPPRLLTLAGREGDGRLGWTLRKWGDWGVRIEAAGCWGSAHLGHLLTVWWDANRLR